MGSLKVFVDSNVILEHLKGTIDLTKIRRKEFNLYTNSIVFSEVLYVYLKVITGKKSYELKKDPELVIKYKQDIYESSRILSSL